MPWDKVFAARSEEVEFMMERDIWTLKPVSECWEKLGRGPTTVRWVDVNKGDRKTILVRSRLVARDFKGGDKGRDDLFADTPPLEAKRLMFSKAATKGRKGWRKLMFIDAKKAHLNPRCEEDIYVELPEECEAPPGLCGKLNFWLYGFRKAASAWENHYSEMLEEVGFEKGDACGMVFYHPGKDLPLAAHGDDFTFCVYEEDLFWIRDLMASWFEIKVRGIVGGGPKDDKEIVILGRLVQWGTDGIRYQADPKHRRLLLEHFGLDENSRSLKSNGEKEVEDQGDEREDLTKEETTVFRGLAALLNLSRHSVSRKSGGSGNGEAYVGVLEDIKEAGEILGWT